MLGIFSAGIAPGLALLSYFYLKDEYGAEPLSVVFRTFIYGALLVFPIMFIQYVIDVEHLVVSEFLNAFLTTGFLEEFFKWFILFYAIYQHVEFDEPFDGIVYSVMIGMGFATVENILYVQQHGLGTALVRMFLSVPAHATFAILMGYFAGKAKFKPERRKFYLFTGIFWAAFFHGTYDFFLFLQGNPTVNKYLSDSLLFAGAVGSFIFAVWLSKRAIKEHHNLSKNMFHPDI